MILHWKPLSLLLVLAFFTTGYLQAQEPSTPTSGKKEEHIVIRKKGNSNEKLTIVVDGGNITVNGKPLAEFKNDSIEVKLGLSTMHFAPRAPRAPGLPAEFMLAAPGGVKAYSGDALRHFKGVANTSFLGVAAEKADKGVSIMEVTKESPAEKAGLLKGDIITKIGDSSIENAERLYAVVGKHKPDEKIQITYLRDGKENTTTATLEANPRVFSLRFDDNIDFAVPREMQDFRFEQGDMTRSFNMAFGKHPRLGLQVKDTEDGKGVRVLDVAPDSPGTKAGIQKDDLITGINGRDVNSVDAIRDQLHGAQPGDIVKIEFRRNNKRQTVEVKFPQQLKTSNL
jgi:serine protease Do